MTAVREPLTEAPTATPLLHLAGISKSFGGVRALSDASLDIRPGEVHALLGENGAGKSTLVKIIAGMHQRDAGTIAWQGEPTEIGSFAAAERLGIHVIYQQLNVLDHLTAAENMTLGRERSRFTFIDLKEQRRRAQEEIDALGVDIDVDRRAADLRIAEKQLVEIARALWGSVRLLIMDEPTSSLGDREVDRLFTIIERLREQGIAVVYISHKLDEVFRLADRITVLRDGKTVGTVATRDTTHDDLIAMMVGRQLGHVIERARSQSEDVVLDVVDLGTDTGLEGVSFGLHRGEIIGVYGLLGSGRTELCRVLVGADPVRVGRIDVSGETVRFASPADARRHGLGLVTEERSEASFPLLSVRQNLTAAAMDLIAPRHLLRPRLEVELAKRIVAALSIRTASIEQPLKSLSGGNQQKVMVGRWLMRDTPIMVLDDPTSGIDVGAKDELYRLLADMTKEGTSVIMTSSELPELMALSDRILVLRGGRVAGILGGDGITEENVVRLAVSGIGPPGHGEHPQPAEVAG